MRSKFSISSSGTKSVEALYRFVGKVGEYQGVEREPPVAPEPLTVLQTIALLRMANSTLCRGIATHLQKDVQDKPQISDYRELVLRRLASRPADEKWHRITPLGEYEALKLAKAEAKRAGIHVMIEGGWSGASQSFHCTCGKFNIGAYRSANGAASAYQAWCRHVAAASPTCEAESA